MSSSVVFMKHQATASSLMSFKSQPLIFWGKRLCIYSPDSLCWTHITSQHTVWWFWLTLPYVSLTHGGCPGDNLCLLIREMHYVECLSCRMALRHKWISRSGCKKVLWKYWFLVLASPCTIFTTFHLSFRIYIFVGTKGGQHTVADGRSSDTI